jgi:uncharacterized membrane protein YfcA
MNFLIGLASGFFGGLIGLGGGVIMIPLLVRFYKFSQHQAHGTSLMALIFTGLAGAIAYYRQGSVDLVAVLILAAAAMVTARFGALYAHSLPEWKLKQAFGIFLIFVSLLLLIKPWLAHLSLLSHPATGLGKVLALLASGAAAGFISAMMGVGGGAVMVPALVLLVGLSQYAAQGSSLAVMVPSATVGALTHWRLGNVVTGILPGLIAGILLGAFLGGSAAHLISEAHLRLIFAAVLIWLGLRDIRGAQRKKLALAAAAAATPNSGSEVQD